MSDEIKDVGGRPPHQPTDESRLLVKELYMAGIAKKRIAERFEISEDTLNKYYVDQLDNSKERAASLLAKNLYQDALDGNEKAREFWLKCQARWSYAKEKMEDEDNDKKVSVLELLQAVIESKK